jgi:serine/threonine protein kinase
VSALLHECLALVTFHSCHADIKPDNILLVRGEFKLADPGFARFQKLQKEIFEGRHGGIEVPGGTSKYSAPERFYRNIRDLDHTKSDLWSFGCVLSEAATWIVLGRTGIRQYSFLRIEALSRLSQREMNLEQSVVKHLSQSDCFHDGSHVLSEVTEWHKFLRSIIRPTDTTTSQILDMIDQQIFLADPKSRSDAKQICQWWSEQRDSPGASPVTVSQTIERLLIDTEKEEVAEILNRLGSQDTEERRAAKSSNSFLQVPAAHPSSVTPGASRRPSTSDAGGHATLPATPLAAAGNVVTPPPQPTTGGFHRRSTYREDSISSLHLTSSQGSNEGKHSVFDAYYHHMSEKDKHHAVFRWLSKEDRQKKDDRLRGAIFDRDLIFLVDNGQSMLEYWSEAMFLLEILVTKTWNIDPDGVELMFTNTSFEVKGEAKKKERDLEEFKKAMTNPEVRPANWRTDMSVKLNDVLFKWLSRFKKNNLSGKPTNSLTVIVLTDGKWEGMASKPLEVDDMIVDFHARLRELVGAFQPKRPVSIQFVSFGHDPNAIYRLRRLDNDLGYRGVP